MSAPKIKDPAAQTCHSRRLSGGKYLESGGPGSRGEKGNAQIVDVLECAQSVYYSLFSLSAAHFYGTPVGLLDRFCGHDDAVSPPLISWNNPQAGNWESLRVARRDSDRVRTKNPELTPILPGFEGGRWGTN